MILVNRKGKKNWNLDEIWIISELLLSKLSFLITYNGYYLILTNWVVDSVFCEWFEEWIVVKMKLFKNKNQNGSATRTFLHYKMGQTISICWDFKFVSLNDCSSFDITWNNSCITKYWFDMKFDIYYVIIHKMHLNLCRLLINNFWNLMWTQPVRVLVQLMWYIRHCLPTACLHIHA